MFGCWYSHSFVSGCELAHDLFTLIPPTPCPWKHPLHLSYFTIIISTIIIIIFFSLGRHKGQDQLIQDPDVRTKTKFCFSCTVSRHTCMLTSRDWEHCVQCWQYQEQPFVSPNNECVFCLEIIGPSKVFVVFFALIKVGVSSIPRFNDVATGSKWRFKRSSSGLGAYGAKKKKRSSVFVVTSKWRFRRHDRSRDLDPPMIPEKVLACRKTPSIQLSVSMLKNSLNWCFHDSLH
jgi:hypothetical protein